MITLSHGAGGRKTQMLIEGIARMFKYRNYNSLGLDGYDDGSAIKFGKEHLVFTSDSYTVNPFFFKGGDIGKLTACGVINDLSVMGAKPIAMHSNLLLEEGFSEKNLERIMRSLSLVLRKNRVHLLGGDTKVLERGKLGGIVISAFGVGIASRLVVDSGLKAGDSIVVSGTIGEHEMAIFSEREKLDFSGNFISDCAPLYDMIKRALVTEIHSMKDITRGGLAGALNELAVKSKANINIEENMVPVRDSVRNACEVFGFDPLALACEGRIVIGVKKKDAGKLLRILRKTKSGRNASVIGRVSKGTGEVIMNTEFGGRRLVQVPAGSTLPRIC